MLFDDPLSALDANVSSFLMENTICNELKGKTRVIVTHAIHFLKFADVIVMMDKGEIAFSGNYEQLKKTDLLRNLTIADSSTSETEEEEGKKKKKKAAEPVKKEENEVRAIAQAEKLDPVLSKFAAEERTKGTISCSVIHAYITNTGGYFIFIFLIIFTAIATAMQAYGGIFLLKWTNEYQPETKWQTFGEYCSILYGYCLLQTLRMAIMLALGIGYSRNAHASMVFKVLHTQVEEFIEKVSMGRILNRFTKDMDVIDKNIMRTSAQLIFWILIVLTDCVFMALQLDPVILGPLAAFVIFSFWLQRRSMGVKREAVRLEAISKSPIIGWTEETLKGLPQIRSMNKLSYVTKNMVDMLHANMADSILSSGLDAWFRIRISMFNIFIVQIPTYSYILYYKLDLPVEKVAFFLLLSTILTEDILRTLQFFSLVETNLVSIERVDFFEKLPYEANYFTVEKERKKFLYLPDKVNLRSLTMNPTSNIVNKGEVVFKNLTARYGEDAEPVLKNLDFSVRPGEKIGIVGRTGAGKSSLIKLFWMCLRPSEGQVLVDGTDISKVDLKVLRNEVMVVTQDTAMFQGNLAENIDPNMLETDYPQAMTILNELGIKNKNILEQGMDCEVKVEGNNFSQGEKQIICYARTLINQKKIIILDEATANIDMKTEQAIKKIQETKFAGSTMFIIAHRLKTVMHCDRIMVLKFGKIVEFDTPTKLLEMQGGLFKDMYDKYLEQGEEL